MVNFTDMVFGQMFSVAGEATFPAEEMLGLGLKIRFIYLEKVQTEGLRHC